MRQHDPSSQRPARGGDQSERSEAVGADPLLGPETSAVIAAARAEIGKPYAGPLVGQPDSARWGSVGWDCSSFVSAMYERVYGVKLTAFTDDAHRETVPVDEPKPGDIVFYRYHDPSQPGVTYPHMGLYLGPGRVLDSRAGAGVGVHDDVRGARAEYRQVRPRAERRSPAPTGTEASGSGRSPAGSAEPPRAEPG
jgi:cell wall-associated NlpC family hydrolase